MSFPFSSFWSSTLTFPCLSRLLLTTPFASVSTTRKIIPLPVSLPQLMFQQMVDHTEPLCKQINASLAQILAFDTSDIELYVTENNPQTLNSLIRRLRAYYKEDTLFGGTTIQNYTTLKLKALY